MLPPEQQEALSAAFGGQELNFSPQDAALLHEILGENAEMLMRMFRGDRVYVKKNTLASARKNQLAFVGEVKKRRLKGQSLSSAIKDSAKAFGFSQRWGYELLARYKRGELGDLGAITTTQRQQTITLDA